MSDEQDLCECCVSGGIFLLVPAYPGSPRQKAVKRLCVYILSRPKRFSAVR